MKNILAVICFSIVLTSCENKMARTDYIISGKAEGLYNGVRVYLNEIKNGRQVPVDTAMVMNDIFQFTGSVDYPKLYYFTANGISGRYEFMVENSVINMTIDTKILNNSTVDGSESHDLFSSFNSEYQSLKAELIKAESAYSQSEFIKDSVKMAVNENAVKIITKKFNELPYKFIEENSNKHVILPVIKSQLYSRELDIQKMVEVYQTIDTVVTNTDEGKLIGQAINQLKTRIEAEKATAIGVKAPEFSAPNPNGEIISLSDVVKKGKITIIDFWAAWCGPCRKENPNVVRIYEKYHDKGLEIIGVGLDGRRGQRNPKEAWIKAIENDKLTWHQVSNLKYFDEIARTYNVTAIPAMFVLNEKGEIIDKNLRGRALEQRIGELLD